jgi:hypothetical protein
MENVSVQTISTVQEVKARPVAAMQGAIATVDKSVEEHGATLFTRHTAVVYQLMSNPLPTLDATKTTHTVWSHIGWPGVIQTYSTVKSSQWREDSNTLPCNGMASVSVEMISTVQEV